MNLFFKLIFGNFFYHIYSYIIKSILVLKGVKVGKNFFIAGTPKLKIRTYHSNIEIKNNVKILGDIDLRTRENGKIIINDNVTIEENCRIVSARDGKIFIDENTIVCAYSTINGGEDVMVGKNCIIGRNTSINSNSHKIKREYLIMQQGFDHEKVIIEDDCWTGINSVITKGVTLKKGSIIGASSVVNKSTEEDSINVGAPCTKINERK